MNAKNVPSFSFTVDWISVTFDEYHGFKFAKKLGYKTWAKDVAGLKPRGYDNARELETGANIAWHSTRKDMGVHITLSGSVLRAYEALNVNWHTMLTWIKSESGRTSRVDLAIDIHDGGLKLSDLSKPHRLPYKGKGRTPRWLPVGDDEDGWTMYVGSRTSEKYLRIYDKGKEQGEKDSDYVRVELECKGEIAHAVGWEFPNMAREMCVGMAQTLIRTVANVDHEVWDAAMRSVNVALTLPQGKQRDTLGWLVKVCAPALAKEIAKSPSGGVLGDFWDALRRSLSEYGLDAEI